MCICVMMCVQKYLQVHSNRGNEAIVANEAMSVRVVRFPNALRFMTQIKGHVQKDTRVLLQVSFYLCRGLWA